MVWREEYGGGKEGEINIEEGHIGAAPKFLAFSTVAYCMVTMVSTYPVCYFYEGNTDLSSSSLRLVASYKLLVLYERK